MMKTPNKRELHQTAFDCSLDIAFRDVMNLYMKCTEKPYSFLVVNTTLALDNPLCFRTDLLEVT